MAGNEDHIVRCFPSGYPYNKIDKQNKMKTAEEILNSVGSISQNKHYDHKIKERILKAMHEYSSEQTTTLTKQLQEAQEERDYFKKCWSEEQNDNSIRESKLNEELRLSRDKNDENERQWNEYSIKVETENQRLEADNNEYKKFWDSTEYEKLRKANDSISSLLDRISEAYMEFLNNGTGLPKIQRAIEDYNNLKKINP